MKQVKQECCKFKDGDKVFDKLYKQIFSFNFQRDKYIIYRLEIYTNQSGEWIND